MLNALDNFQPITVGKFCLRTPHMYLFDRNTNTQVLEDLSGSIDMKAVLKSSLTSSVLPRPILSGIGRALGTWLQSFHSWVSEPPQADLQKSIGKNESMRKIRYEISYGAFIDIVQKFQKVWEIEGCEEALEEVKHMATGEYAMTTQDEAGQSWGIIHADFWSGK